MQAEAVKVTMNRVAEAGGGTAGVEPDSVKVVDHRSRWRPHHTPREPRPGGGQAGACSVQFVRSCRRHLAQDPLRHAGDIPHDEFNRARVWRNQRAAIGRYRREGERARAVVTAPWCIPASWLNLTRPIDTQER